MKNRKYYVITKSNLTLTQSGMLAPVVATPAPQSDQVGPASGIPRAGACHIWEYSCWGALRMPSLVDNCAEPLAATYGGKLESFNKPMAMSHQVCPYTELRKQIHDDLQIQHPEWVQLNGESPMCDSYEARLVELFDAFKRREREGTKRVKESLNPERWLCRHASFKALAHFVTIRMPLKSDESVDPIHVSRRKTPNF